LDVSLYSGEPLAFLRELQEHDARHMIAPTTGPSLARLRLLLASVLVSLFFSACFFRSEIKAEYQLPTSGASLVVGITPRHLYLAEYDRRISVVSDRGKRVRVDLFPDTGGYVRTQLYQGSDTKYYAKGCFDLAILDVEAMTIDTTSMDLASGAVYLGAFDVVRGEGWQFLPADQSPEESMRPEDRGAR